MRKEPVMKFFPLRQCLLLALACTAGCAGGGGDSGAMSSNPYPPINSVTSSTTLSVVSSNVTFDNPTTRLTAAGGTVGISANGNGAAITSMSLNVAGASGVSFQQTFNSFTPELDSQGATVLYVASVTASDGSVRQVLFANPGHPLFSLTYTTFGFWEYDASAIATSGVGGAFATGVATRTNDLPTTGTANYSGGLIGRYADGTTSWAVTAGASSMANFGTGTLSLTTSNSFRAPVSGGPAVADNSLNLSGALLFPPGTNQLSGTLTSTGGMTGPASAKFFGPGAQELGGAFFVTNGGSQQMTGAFGLHR